MSTSRLEWHFYFHSDTFSVHIKARHSPFSQSAASSLSKHELCLAPSIYSHFYNVCYSTCTSKHCFLSGLSSKPESYKYTDLFCCQFCHFMCHLSVSYHLLLPNCPLLLLGISISRIVKCVTFCISCANSVAITAAKRLTQTS